MSRQSATVRRARWVGWVAVLAVVAVGLVIGVTDGSGPGSVEERARSLGATIQCPTCTGQSVIDSDASAARGIRSYISERIDEGASDEEITSELVGRFGDDILLTPSRSGVAGLVWVLPIVVLVVAFVGVGLAFRRWRVGGDMRASEADRALVDRARRGGAPPEDADAAPSSR